MYTHSKINWVLGVWLCGLMLLVRSALPQAVGAAGVWYVKNGGNDSNDCATPATACASINGALAKPGFVAGDTIRVAVGTYTGTGAEVVLIDKDATVSGGWDAATFTTQSGMATIDGQGVRRGITINGEIVVSLDRFNIQYCFGESGGGGISSTRSNVVVSNSTVYSNTVGSFPYGGGIRFLGGSLNILYSEVINNTADAGGGIASAGVLTVTNSLVANNIARAGVGGGIYNYGGSDIFAIRNSTISNNTGAGIYNLGYNTGVIINGTISGNSGGEGGGIYNYGGGITIKSTTITGNRATRGGGIYEPLGFAGASTNLENTIIAGNTASTSGQDCYGLAYSLGYNLFGSTEGCYLQAQNGLPNILNTNPNLAPLMENGGGIPTHALLAASAAIDGGNPTGCADTNGLLTTDERGYPRTGHCDIGSFELQPLDNSTKTVNPTAVAVGNMLNYAVIVKNNASSSVTGVFVTDTLPTTLDFVPGSLSATQGVPVHANRVITWNGNINANGVVTITFGARVNPSASVGDVIINSVLISGGAITVTRSASADVISPLAFSTKMASKSVARLGESIDYAIMLANQNATEIPNVIVTDTLPAVLKYKSGSLSATSGNAVYSNGVITWTGTVPPQNQVTISFGTSVDRSAPLGTTLVNTVLINNNGLIVSRSANVYLSPHLVYLPNLLLNYAPPPTCAPGICGYVRFNGAVANGVPVDLRFYNGASWSTLASTMTAASGRYAFTGVPGLMAGQRYYVRFSNSTNAAQLSSWATRVLTEYAAGSDVGIGDFDIANVPLTAPAPGSLVSLPTAFQWGVRSATLTDRYEFNLLDYTDGNPWWWTGPLGYIGGYTMNTLPAGFGTNTPYGWYAGIYGPDGGYGQSYYMYVVGFSNTGNAPRPSAPARARPLPEDLPRPKISNR